MSQGPLFGLLQQSSKRFHANADLQPPWRSDRSTEYGFSHLFAAHLPPVPLQQYHHHTFPLPSFQPDSRRLPPIFNFDFASPQHYTMPTAVARPPPNASVIDLTIEDSPPRPAPLPIRSSATSHRATRPRRSGLEVIDLDDLSDNSPPRPARRQRIESADIEFTYSRPATHPLQRIPDDLLYRPPEPLEPHHMYRQAGEDFERDTRGVGDANARRRLFNNLHASFALPGGGFGRPLFFEAGFEDNAELLINAHARSITPAAGHRPAGRRRQRASTGDDVIIVPKYQPPPEPPNGFTRSPQDDDLLLCPNCDDELSTGEHPEKRQVYIVRNCGHVYCGECALNRSLRPKKSGVKSNPPKVHRPFTLCVVDGCNSKTSAPRSMFRIRF